MKLIREILIMAGIFTAGDLKKALRRRCVVCGDPISRHIRGMYCDEECKSLARYYDFERNTGIKEEVFLTLRGEE